MFLIGFLDGSVSKEPACSAGDPVKSLGQEDPVEKEMATHSGILAWRIPGTAEAGRLPSVGLHRVGHNWSDLAAAAAALDNSAKYIQQRKNSLFSK